MRSHCTSLFQQVVGLEVQNDEQSHCPFFIKLRASTQCYFSMKTQ